MFAHVVSLVNIRLNVYFVFYKCFYVQYYVYWIKTEILSLWLIRFVCVRRRTCQKWWFNIHLPWRFVRITELPNAQTCSRNAQAWRRHIDRFLFLLFLFFLQINILLGKKVRLNSDIILLNLLRSYVPLACRRRRLK